MILREYLTIFLDLCTAIQKMSHLRSLGILATSEEEVLNLQSLPSPPPLLQTLFLLGKLEKFPKWIPKLKSMASLILYWSKLMKDPLKVSNYILREEASRNTSFYSFVIWED